jgi:lysozyme family protein
LVDTANIAPHISIDGGIGTFTITAVTQTLASMGPKAMVNAYQDARQAFYNNIVVRKPSQGQFLAGWTNRVNAFRMP